MRESWQVYNKPVQAQNKSSHVGKKLRSTLIHTFETDSYINMTYFDYQWLCVWFGSYENQRLTQSQSSGILHVWPVELYWVKCQTSHEPN